jgi:hypothetical protein
LEGLDVVLQTVLGHGRIGNDHYGLFRGIFSGLAPGQHGVGWVDGEAVVTFGPPLKESVSGDVSDDALWAVGASGIGFPFRSASGTGCRVRFR